MVLGQIFGQVNDRFQVTLNVNFAINIRFSDRQLVVLSRKELKAYGGIANDQIEKW